MYGHASNRCVKDKLTYPGLLIEEEEHTHTQRHYNHV